MSPSLSFLLNTQIDSTVIKCHITNDQRIFHVTVSVGSESLQEAILIISTLIDCIGIFAVVLLESPVDISANSAAATAVQPDFITNMSRQFNVLIVISLYSKTSY